MFCPNCGTQLPDDARFCADCGISVIGAVPVKSEDTAVPPQKAPKKRRKGLILLPIILVVVALTTAVWQLFFSKKTVYLTTYSETINYSDGNARHTIYEYAYGDTGDLLSYSYEYFSDQNLQKNGLQIEYEYDEDGRLETAQYEYRNTAIDYTYSYTRDGVLKKVIGTFKDNDSQIVGACNENGQIVSLKHYDPQGEVVTANSYKYNRDGTLAQKTSKSRGYLYKYIYENGHLVEQIIRHNGMTIERRVYAYDDEGRLTEQSTYGEDDALTASILLEYTFQGKKLTGITVTVKDADGNEYVFSGEAQWDGRAATIELDFSKVDAEDAPDEARIEVLCDKHGNMTDMWLYADDELVQEQHYVYEKMRVPRNYIGSWSIDPIWLLN